MTKLTVFFVSSSMIFMKNQVAMVTFIIILCVFLAAWMFLMSNIHWFSFLILLIYISGVMVLFMFIVSLSPNEKTKMKKVKKITMMAMVYMWMTATFMASENSKVNSSLEWTLNIMVLSMAIIFLMAYLPPKVMKSFYSGMKSSK